jgi:DNA-binding response OmpR family regulator
LAVDDEPDITLTVKAGLEATGLFQVDTFNDPELALSSFKPRLYDIVLLDFKMPKMYGYELYDEMKKIDNKVKVCFMTATYQNYEGLRAAFSYNRIRVLYSKASGKQRLDTKGNRRVRAAVNHAP